MMNRNSQKLKPKPRGLEKCPTGITGLDEVTQGGLPRGRTTLVCGSAGCGKTLLGMEFLIRGVQQYGEAGVFMPFEETARELSENVASLGFDLNRLVARKKIVVDHVRIERSEIEETGEYDLEGLFVRLGHAIDSIGAKRVVLDTIESLFGGLANESILRAELRRLFHWLKDRNVTTIVTGEQGQRTLTRHGLEEYVSDCVIVLDHRVREQISTRRLRVVKYRGSVHGTNEYPFLIDQDGFSVLPITSLVLKHVATTERVATGIRRLDEMLGGGYYRGSTILISGTAGTGKTSMSAVFADAACRRGERCLYFLFEESPSQLMRNMRSIGVNLEPWVKKGLLYFEAARPTQFGLEMHLAIQHKAIADFQPRVVIVDPITNFLTISPEVEIKIALMRLVDILKSRQITSLFTSLTQPSRALEQTDIGISSLVDTWLLLRDIESNGERNRAIHVLKSRGMAHSNQIREFRLSEHGVELEDVYVGPGGGLLTGSARLAQEAKESADATIMAQELEHKRRQRERKRKLLEAQIAALKADFEAEEEELVKVIGEEQAREAQRVQARRDMARSRKSASASLPNGNARQTAKKGARV
jgi:circadian clock protein KaiC